MLIAGIVYGRGYGRAFSIGCVSAGGCLPLIYIYGVMAILSSGGDWSGSVGDDSTLMIKIAFAVFTVLVGLSGLAAMAVRWFSLPVKKKAIKQTPSSPPEYSVLHGRVTAIQMESTPVEPELEESASPE
jgi:hypothetical protein